MSPPPSLSPAWEQDQPMPVAMVKRFWNYVQKGDVNGCWIWIGRRFGVTQYGAFAVCVQSWRGRAWRPEAAHRVAYELLRGHIPTGLHVLHSCDNKQCVNPDHLRLGTDQENKRDALVRGRIASGHAHWNAKLSTTDVKRIREAYASGTTMTVLAQKYGVDYGTVQPLLHGRTWKRASGPILGSGRRNTSLSQTQVLQIRRERLAGMPLAALAKRFGVSKHTIWLIVVRKTWRHLP